MDFFLNWEGEEDYLDDDSTARDSLIDDPDADRQEVFSPYEETYEEDLKYDDMYDNDVSNLDHLSMPEILALAGAYVDTERSNSETKKEKTKERVSLKAMANAQESKEPSYARKTRFERWAMDVATGKKTIHDPLD